MSPAFSTLYDLCVFKQAPKCWLLGRDFYARSWLAS